MPPRTVSEDNNKFSFVSLAISLGGRSYTEINGISYADTINRSFVYGTSPYPLARTRGTYAAGGMISILKEAHDDFLQFLGSGWAALSFDITCSYQENGTGKKMITDQLVSAAFANGEDAWKFGPDPLYVSANLTMIMIIRNGIKPYK